MRILYSCSDSTCRTKALSRHLHVPIHVRTGCFLSSKNAFNGIQSHLKMLSVVYKAIWKCICYVKYIPEMHLVYQVLWKRIWITKYFWWALTIPNTYSTSWLKPSRSWSSFNSSKCLWASSNDSLWCVICWIHGFHSRGHKKECCEFLMHHVLYLRPWQPNRNGTYTVHLYIIVYVVVQFYLWFNFILKAICALWCALGQRPVKTNMLLAQGASDNTCIRNCTILSWLTEISNSTVLSDLHLHIPGMWSVQFADDSNT